MPLSDRDFTIKRNDTLPKLEVSIYGTGCLGQTTNFDLTGATGVTFSMVDTTGNYKIAGKAGQILSSSGGTIQYSWVSEDTDQEGVYNGEFQINYSNGDRLSVPQQGFINIEIFRDIIPY